MLKGITTISNQTEYSKFMIIGCNRKFSIKKANHYIFWLALIFQVDAIVMRLIPLLCI